MKISMLLSRFLLFAGLLGMMLPAVSQAAGKYKNFKVAVYMPVGVVKENADLNVLAKHWATISSQVKVDKVYIEVQRDRTVASDQLIEQTKKFFEDHGVQVAGGITFSDNNS